jgi:hypothetical protein
MSGSGSIPNAVTEHSIEPVTCMALYGAVSIWANVRSAPEPGVPVMNFVPK